MEAGIIAQRPDDQAAIGHDLRAQLREMWSSVAGSWAEHAAYTDVRGAAVTEKMLELTAPRPGDRVLELACGPGSVGLAAASRVPDADVVLSDLVPDMTSIASARAAALGLRNVSTRDLDLERIDEPDGSFDVVLCREGLMLVPDPASSAREIRRILRPGGRVSVAVWGPRERNPWLGLVFDAVSAQTGMPVPPPGVPGPFSLDEADTLASLFRQAGLANVAIHDLVMPLRAASFEEWWTRTAALAGPLAKRLASMPEGAAQALRARLQEAARPFETSEGLEFPGLTLVASARHA